MTTAVAAEAEDFQLMTTDQVHELTGIAVGTLRSWRSRGGVEGPPSFRLGSVVVYRRSGVLAWIRAGEEAEQERRGDRRRQKR